MKLAFAYGRFCSTRGPFDVDGLHKTRGLTGSESYFFNTVRGLAELGHDVTAYCLTTKEGAAPNLGGAVVRDLAKLELMSPSWWADHDAVVSWNEPDLLRSVPRETLRACVQQLNDFNYCRPGYDEHVDMYALPSQHHRDHLIKTCGLNVEKTCVLPNSINLEHFDGLPEREPGRLVYCSSPDRGLHRLLEVFPRVRSLAPGATLRVFYEYESWHARFKDQPGELGTRARYIHECLRRLGTKGENGVELVGPVSNVDMAKELGQAQALVYPCDTVAYTEGFGVSILDACAAGAVPIISDVDAIGSVFKDAAVVIPGRPGGNLYAWIDAVVGVLASPAAARQIGDRCRRFAAGYSREISAIAWESSLRVFLTGTGRWSVEDVIAERDCRVGVAGTAA